MRTDTVPPARAAVVAALRARTHAAAMPTPGHAMTRPVFRVDAEHLAEYGDAALDICRAQEREHGGESRVAFARDRDGTIVGLVFGHRPAATHDARAAAIRAEAEKAHADAEMWGAC